MRELSAAGSPLLNGNFIRSIMRKVPPSSHEAGDGQPPIAMKVTQRINIKGVQARRKMDEGPKDGTLSTMKLLQLLGMLALLLQLGAVSGRAARKAPWECPRTRRKRRSFQEHERGKKRRTSWRKTGRYMRCS